MTSRDQRPGEAPDVRVSVDESITYAMVVGIVRGVPARLLLRYTAEGELLASIAPISGRDRHDTPPR